MANYSLLRLILPAILLCSASSQMIAEELNIMMLKNVIDIVNEIKESQMAIRGDLSETLKKLADLEISHKSMLGSLTAMEDSLTAVEDSQRDMEENLKKLQMKSEIFEESQMALRGDLNDTLRKLADLEEQRVDYQQCATHDQVEIIQNSIIADRQEVLHSLKQCNIRDQMPSVYELIKSDKCQTDSNLCHEHASCTSGTLNYTCSCLPGYTGDGFTCEDVDECSTEQHSCAVNAKCINTEGNYSCDCVLPSAGDGYTCDDLACRSPSVWMEDLGCVTPSLTTMNWEDAKSKCLESAGSRLIENIQKKHFDILLQHFGGSTGKFYFWIGVRDVKWLSSGNQVAQELYHSNDPEGLVCGHIHLRDTCLGLGDFSCSNSGSLRALCQSHYE